MRKWLITLAVLMQAAVLAYMVWGRESIISHGTRIVLDTAPVDPRDPFRGDFVRLDYAMNSLALAPVRWSPEDYEPQKNDTLYAVHAPGAGGVHELKYFTNVFPSLNDDTAQVALRGRFSRYQNVSGETTWYLRYGIEQLFVEQGSGLAIEERRGIRGGMQNPMQIEVSVGKQGTAIIRDYSWGPLAIELELTDTFTIQPPGNQSTPFAEGNEPEEADIAAVMPAIRIHIQNLSNHAITLNNPGNNCGFALQPVLKARSAFEAADDSCAQLTSISPVTLAPEQVLSIDVDLANPRWHIREKSSHDGSPAPSWDPRQLGSASNESLRIVYRSDAQPEAAGDADLWRGNLQSQAFTPTGTID